MKGILSSNIDHYKYTAMALQDCQKIEKYISCAFYKEKPWYYDKCKRLKEWRDNRIEKNLDYDLLKSFKYQEIIYKSIRNVNKVVSKNTIDMVFNCIFDRRSKKILKAYDELGFFHYVSGIGYQSALFAKEKLNSTIIVDDRAEHKGFLHDILVEEYMKLGIEYSTKGNENIGQRKDYEIADYIITPSTFAKSTFITQGVDEKKLVVIPYGCNTDLFYPIDRQEDNIFRIIYVGSVCIRKGAHYLLEAFNKINNPNIELLIIGKVEPELEEMMKNSNSNVKHINYVPNNKLNEYYAQSNVFILPSLSDSFSLATLEAMSAGLPVIVSENVGAKDFVIDGINGYIVPIRDSKIIKEKIEHLYENPSICKIMSKNSAKIKEQIKWNKYQDEIKNFYENFID